ncbi:MAG: FAD-binding protein [Methylobacillus sp.]|jgi:electron transfer flavoprotein alpha subunit|nr:FAD-binding protein [Methylobacillus sp.]
MSVLLLADHNGRALNPSLRHLVTAAQAWNAEIHVLVAGSDTTAVANEAAQIAGIAKVIRVDAPHLEHLLAEDLANILAALGKEYTAILGAHDAFARNVLPRVAALLDVAMISDALEIQPDNIYTRPIYAGSVIATVQSRDPIQIVTARASRFKPAGDGGSAEIISVDATPAFGKTRWISHTLQTSERPALASARVVISGGKSLGSAEKFSSVLSPLADKLNAALGATRAAVDAGYASNEIQVGQTGVVVSPELYIAAGISGAVQHTYGMKDSKIIVAINQDPDAPIFNVADYGLVADLFEVVPELTAQLDNTRAAL